MRFLQTKKERKKERKRAWVMDACEKMPDLHLAASFAQRCICKANIVFLKDCEVIHHHSRKAAIAVS
jgi:hypothetical protein